MRQHRRGPHTGVSWDGLHFVQPHDDPDTWLTLEMFRSRAAWDEHMRQPYVTEGNKLLEDLLREPSDLRLGDEK